MTLTANDFLANFGELLRCKRCKLSSSIFIQMILTKLHLHILTNSDRENTTCFHELVQLCLTRTRSVLDFSIIKSLTPIVVVHEAIFFISCMHFQLSTRPPIIIYVYHHHHHQLYQESNMIGQNPDLDSFTFSSLRTRLKIKIPSEMEVAPRYIMTHRPFRTHLQHVQGHLRLGDICRFLSYWTASFLQTGAKSRATSKVKI